MAKLEYEGITGGKGWEKQDIYRALADGPVKGRQYGVYTPSLPSGDDSPAETNG